MLKQHEDYGVLIQGYTNQQGGSRPFGSDIEKPVLTLFRHSMELFFLVRTP